MLILLFSLFLLLFMSSITLFGTIYGSHCIISTNFYFYLQYFQQKKFQFRQNKWITNKPYICYSQLFWTCIVSYHMKTSVDLPNQQGKHDQKNILVWCVCMLYMEGGKMPLMLYLARDIPLETGFLHVMFYRVFLTKNGRLLFPFFP